MLTRIGVSVAFNLSLLVDDFFDNFTTGNLQIQTLC